MKEEIIKNLQNRSETELNELLTTIENTLKELNQEVIDFED